MLTSMLLLPKLRDLILKTVFLDRDGVINQKMPEGEYVRSAADFHMLPGVPAAIARLNRVGARVIVVSNQRGVALGLYTTEAVDSIHANLQNELRSFDAHIDAFFYCAHDKESCNCRKPLPGLFEQARACFPNITPKTSIMIGDSASDIEFGRAVGMRTIWIEGCEANRKLGREKAAGQADASFASLPEAVEGLLGRLEHLESGQGHE
jgi:D-glycero-D-manno-heptose 1,7-bisphosphate phosphatase